MNRMAGAQRVALNCRYFIHIFRALEHRTIREDVPMTLFNALRDLVDGLTRGFSLFLTERHNAAVDVLARRDVR
jgi:hypothetical protein